MRGLKRFLFAAFFMLSLAGCRGGQVADLQQQGYNKEDFRLEDFAHFEKFRDAGKILFPVGTPRAEIDHILVKVNKAGHSTYSHQDDKAGLTKPGEKIVRYYKPHNGLLKCTFRVRAIYNSNDVLAKEIFTYYGCTGS